MNEIREENGMFGKVPEFLQLSLIKIFKRNFFSDENHEKLIYLHLLNYLHSCGTTETAIRVTGFA